MVSTRETTHKIGLLPPYAQAHMNIPSSGRAERGAPRSSLASPIAKMVGFPPGSKDKPLLF